MDNPVHMRFARIVMTLIGCWPHELTGWKNLIYKAYFYASFGYYILFDVTLGMMVFFVKGNFLEVASILGVIIVYINHIYKVTICRSATIRNILVEIQQKENLILTNADEKIKKIYYDHIKSLKFALRYYLSLNSCGISLYFITPVVKNIMDENGRKYLIFSSWFPFDPEKHFYLLAYLVQFFGGLYGCAYIACTGSFYFSILQYCVGQIRILKHIFRNLNAYIAKYAQENGIDEKFSEVIFVKLCIREHKYIIGLVERLDGCLKTYMLLEFFISSFQLSLVAFQILQNETIGIERIAVLSYFLTLSSQLSIFYWIAHEIITESTELAQALMESEWFKLDIKVQRLLQFVMLRAQKPIGISIGPIYKVKVDALIGIFKAIYSYVAIIQK